MKRTLMHKLTIAASASALAFGAVACQVEDGDGLEPGQEDPLLDDGGMEDGGMDDGGMEDGGLDDGGMEDDSMGDDTMEDDAGAEG